MAEGRRKKEEGRRKKEEGRGKREEGEEGRGKREDAINHSLGIFFTVEATTKARRQEEKLHFRGGSVKKAGSCQTRRILTGGFPKEAKML